VAVPIFTIFAIFAPIFACPYFCLVCVSVFRAIWGIFDQGPCREIRWKSFISQASPIAEQNADCHKCLNGRMLQPDRQTNPEGREKSPKFEQFALE
jgi:hypothetical protein